MMHKTSGRTKRGRTAIKVSLQEVSVISVTGSSKIKELLRSSSPVGRGEARLLEAAKMLSPKL